MRYRDVPWEGLVTDQTTRYRAQAQDSESVGEIWYLSVAIEGEADTIGVAAQVIYLRIDSILAVREWVLGQDTHSRTDTEDDTDENNDGNAGAE